MSHEEDGPNIYIENFNATEQYIEVRALADELGMDIKDLIRLHLKTSMLARAFHVRGEGEQLLRVDKVGIEEDAYDLLISSIAKSKEDNGISYIDDVPYEGERLEIPITVKGRIILQLGSALYPYLVGFAQDIDQPMDTLLRGIVSFGNQRVRDELRETGYLMVRRDGEDDYRVSVLSQ